MGLRRAITSGVYAGGSLGDKYSDEHDENACARGKGCTGGMLMSGMTTRVTLDDAQFLRTGGACLFSSVLSRFPALCVTPYSLHRSIPNTVSGREYPRPVKIHENTP